MTCLFLINYLCIRNRSITNRTIPSGMTKADYASFKFNSALIEEDDYDMLIMGRTQGKGCYCYVI